LKFVYRHFSFAVKIGQLQHLNMCIYIYIYIYVCVCVCVCVRACFCVHLDRTKYVGTNKYFNHCTGPVLHFTNIRKCPQECHNAMFVLVLSRMYFKRSLNTLFSFVIHVGWKFYVFSCFCFISGCFLYSKTPLIRIYWDGGPPGDAEYPENWIFLLKIGFFGSLKWKTISTNGCLGHICIYLQIKH